MKIKHLNSIFPIAIVIAFLSAFFLSCSANLPDIRTPEYSLIFDFTDEEMSPDVRMSVFIETLSDVRRSESFIIRCDKENLSWETDDLLKIEYEGRTWAGNTNFVLGDSVQFPTGKYFLTYIDASGEELQKAFTVNYESDLYKLKSDEVESFMRKLNAFRKIAIFDSEDTMIYYGDVISELSTPKRIAESFRSADYYYPIWVKRNNSVICITEKKLVKENK